MAKLFTPEELDAKWHSAIKNGTASPEMVAMEDRYQKAILIAEQSLVALREMITAEIMDSGIME